MSAMNGEGEEARSSWQRPDAPLGTLIFREGLLSAEQLEDALGDSVKRGKRLGQVLVERGLLEESQVAKILARQKGLEYVELREVFVDHAAAALLAPDVAWAAHAIPVSVEDGVPLVAVEDPGDEDALAAVARALGKTPRYAVATRTELLRVLGRHFPGTEGGATLAPPPPTEFTGLRVAAPEPVAAALEPEPQAEPEPPAVAPLPGPPAAAPLVDHPEPEAPPAAPEPVVEQPDFAPVTAAEPAQPMATAPEPELVAAVPDPPAQPRLESLAVQPEPAVEQPYPAHLTPAEPGPTAAGPEPGTVADALEPNAAQPDLAPGTVSGPVPVLSAAPPAAVEHLAPRVETAESQVEPVLQVEQPAPAVPRAPAPQAEPPEPVFPEPAVEFQPGDELRPVDPPAAGPVVSRQPVAAPETALPPPAPQVAELPAVPAGTVGSVAAAPEVPVAPAPVVAEPPLPEPLQFVRPADSLEAETTAEPVTDPPVSPVAPEAPAPEAQVAAETVAPVAPVAPASSADGAPHRVVVRMNDGEEIEAARFGAAEDAKHAARQLTREIATAEPGDWPELGGRFVRPELIVAVEILPG